MNKKLLIFVGVAIAVGVIVGVWAASGSDSPPDPKQVARQWVSDKTDAVSEETLRLVLDALGEEGVLATAIAELGGEWLEDRIHENLSWTFSEPVPRGDSHMVVATGAAQVQVDRGPIKGSLTITIPTELTIQGDSVLEARLLADEVSVSISN